MTGPDPSAPSPTPPAEQDPELEATWRMILLGTHPNYRRLYRVFRRLPSSPRCKMCAAPFAGPLTGVMRLAGRARWSKNSRYCGNCFNVLQEHQGGAEIDCSLLFADIRGSTRLAEGMRPTEFRSLLDRFYRVATDVLVDHDAIVDKFVGDEVVALFIPALAQDRHAERALAAAEALLRATGHGQPDGPWAPIGAGVTTGTAFVGAVGGQGNAEMTALGDIVNVAARLASAASAGQVLATAEAATAAGRPTAGRHSLEIRGRDEPVEIVAFEVA